MHIIGEGYMQMRGQTVNFSVSYVEEKTRTGIRDGTTFSAIATTFSTWLGSWTCSRARLLCVEISSGAKVEEKNKANNWICKDIRERMKCQTQGELSQPRTGFVKKL